MRRGRALDYARAMPAAGARRPGPDYSALAVIGLAPAIPLLGLALRNHPKYRLPAVAGAAGAVLFGAHGMGVTVSAGSGR